jgi:hypothetical protein
MIVQNGVILVGIAVLLLGVSSRIIQSGLKKYIQVSFDDEEQVELLEDGFSFGRFIGWPTTIAISVWVLHIPQKIQRIHQPTDGFAPSVLWTLTSWFSIFIAVLLVDFLAYTGVHSGLRQSDTNSSGVLRGWLSRTNLLIKAILGAFFLCILGILTLSVLRLIVGTSVYFQFFISYVLALVILLAVLILLPLYDRLLSDCRPLPDSERKEVEDLLQGEEWGYRELWLDDLPSPEVTIHGLFARFRHVFFSTEMYDKFTPGERKAAFRSCQFLSPSVYNFYRVATAGGILFLLFSINYYLEVAGKEGLIRLLPILFGVLTYAVVSWYGRQWVHRADSRAATHTSIETMIKVLEKQSESSQRSMNFNRVLAFLYMRPTFRQRIQFLSELPEE